MNQSSRSLGSGWLVDRRWAPSGTFEVMKTSVLSGQRRGGMNRSLPKENGILRRKGDCWVQWRKSHDRCVAGQLLVATSSRLEGR